MVMVSLSVLAALGLAWIIEWLTQPGRAPADSGPLAIGPSSPSPSSVSSSGVHRIPFSPPDTPAFYEQLAQEEGEFAVLNLPMNFDRPGYLLYQTVHEKPLTVGYITRNDPRTLVYRAPVLLEWRYLGADILTDDAGALGTTVLDLAWCALCHPGSVQDAGGDMSVNTQPPWRNRYSRETAPVYRGRSAHRLSGD